MKAFPISLNEGDKCYLDQIRRKLEYGTQEQKTNADGVPLYVCGCLLRQEGSNRTEDFQVTIPSKQDITEGIPPFTPIGFAGLRMMTGENNGRPWVSFFADSITKAKE